MKKMKKCILSAILVFAMTFSLISPSAVAADTEQTGIAEEAEQEIAETADNSEETDSTEDSEKTGEEAAVETASETVGKEVLTSSTVRLMADDVTLPEGATFYYQYVITDADYEAGARFDESYLESVQAKIKNGSYVANTIVGIERSADQKTITIYMGSAAGTEVNGFLQPVEQTQPTVKVENSALAELDGWTGVDLNGNSQTLSSSYYIGSAVQTYYGQKNMTFTSSLKLKYGFTYTLTLDEGQSFDDGWYLEAEAAILAGNEKGVLAIDKSEDGRTMTLYFDSYDFYKTALTLPSVTLTDTSNTVFDNAWSDGTTMLATTANLSDYFAFDYSTQSYPNAYDMELSPVIANKTYTIHINLGENGTLTTAQDYANYVSSLAAGSNASEYTVSKDNEGNLVISGVYAGDTGFSLDTDVVEATAGKMFDGFELDMSTTDSAVSCSISCSEDGKWQFTGFSSTDSEISHDIYVNVIVNVINNFCLHA